MSEVGECIRDAVEDCGGRGKRRAAKGRATIEGEKGSGVEWSGVGKLKNGNEGVWTS